MLFMFAVVLISVVRWRSHRENYPPGWQGTRYWIEPNVECRQVISFHPRGAENSGFLVDRQRQF
jgi:hypothetical protein